MTTADVIVVGKGMFGLMAAHLAQQRGANVTLIGTGTPFAATEAAGFLIKPSWLSSLAVDQIAKGYEILKLLYGVETLNFRVLPTNKTVKIDRVLFRYKSKFGPPKIIVDRVDDVKNGEVTTERFGKFKGKVLVAAGVSTNTLVEMPDIRSLMGASLRIQHKQIPEPLLQVYQPYKQAIAFNITEDEVWFGDGTAIEAKNWNEEERVAATIARAEKLLGKTLGPYKVFIGARPYVEGYKAGYFDRPFKNTWVSTGGAKNGSILAAYQAWRFVEEAKL